jgi:hypothetical protein
VTLHRLDKADTGFLVLLGVGVLYLLAGMFWPALPGIPCLIKLQTGWECVGCGLTRGARALLRGDLSAAWAFNPLVFFVAGYCALRLLRAGTTWVSGREWPRALPRWAARPLDAAFFATTFYVLYLRVFHPRTG